MERLYRNLWIISLITSMITLENITKTYHLADIEVPILRGIDLHIEASEYVSIMGASGSGKSTLMNIKIGRAHV